MRSPAGSEEVGGATEKPMTVLAPLSSCSCLEVVADDPSADWGRREGGREGGMGSEQSCI